MKIREEKKREQKRILKYRLERRRRAVEKLREEKSGEERRTRKFIREEKMYVVWVTTKENDEWRWW